MAGNTVPHPENGENLPSYRNSQATISSTSSAPTYNSEVPSYHSRDPSNGQGRGEHDEHNLPSQETDALTIPHSNPNTNPEIRWKSFGITPYSVGHRGSIERTNTRHQYQNVVERRANRSTTIEISVPTPTGPLQTLSEPMFWSGSRPAHRGHTSATLNLSSIRPLYPSHAYASPFYPLEDPDIVGEVDAERARSERRRREIAQRQNTAIETEDKNWSFMREQENGVGRQKGDVRQVETDTRKKKAIQKWHRMSKEMKALGKPKQRED
ncbi:hypothetical protein EV356DRAFT_497322 [Viridothelium virens]|uniref:Uncharacterized protein n=1 Tax=Viridothelium virens TaxID=1048519 RepID=A0A6A6HHL7_VIRVR|nr:hypothetical protein EV356DRAFT_497322 [Viridothelium virens]